MKPHPPPEVTQCPRASVPPLGLGNEHAKHTPGRPGTRYPPERAGGSLTYPDRQVPPHAYGYLGPNMQYQIVPEPHSAWLFLADRPPRRGKLKRSLDLVPSGCLRHTRPVGADTARIREPVSQWCRRSSRTLPGHSLLRFADDGVFGSLSSRRALSCDTRFSAISMATGRR
jgi:hypothetical protein